MEGIDELAAHCGVNVAKLTRAAMAGEISLDQVFRARLENIAPTAEDLNWVTQRYWELQVQKAKAVVTALQAIGIVCHVVSGGLEPTVKPFATRLGIPTHQIHAVPFPLRQRGLAAAIDVACAHPLARDGGKPKVILSLCQSLGLDPQRALLIGDGASDLEAATSLGLFVGFGGVVTRHQVPSKAPCFLSGPSLAGLVLLAADPAAASKLEALHPLLHAAAVQQLSLLP